MRKLLLYVTHYDFISIGHRDLLLSLHDLLHVFSDQVRHLERLGKKEISNNKNKLNSKIDIISVLWFTPYLVGVDDDLALLLVSAGDDEHVVEAGRVVYQSLVLVRGEDVPGPRLQQVDTSLVNGQPEVLRPVGGESLLQLITRIEKFQQVTCQ